MMSLSRLCAGLLCCVAFFFFFKQKTAYEMRISDWSSDVCSSDLAHARRLGAFLRLLEVGDADRARAHPARQVRDEAVVKGHIVLGGGDDALLEQDVEILPRDRKSTRLNSSH